MAFLKMIGMWLLKLILGSFADGLLRADKEKAEREKDALQTQLESLESGKDVEAQIIEARIELDKDVDEKLDLNKEDDPFGFEEYNKR